MTKKEVIVPADDLVCLGKDTLQELIRCKDCKYSKCIEPNDDWWECQHDKRVNHSGGYCNWAERK